MKYNKPKPWNGKDLKGTWEVTLKLDGVRALRAADGSIVSREGNPLHNLQEAFKRLPWLSDAEVFTGSWENTVSAVRTHNGRPVSHDDVYSLAPLDARLYVGAIMDPSADDIAELLLKHAKPGTHDGLVLRQGDRWVKVKASETVDLPVLEVLPGKGRHTGRMGALRTRLGIVGQGFTDAQREEAWTPGMVIEVAYRALSPAGKLKEGRFVRRREDKEPT